MSEDTMEEMEELEQEQDNTEYLVTPKEMRMLERLTNEFGISYTQMMENAGKALAEILLEEYPDKNHFLFLAGTGNNGGDCYVSARYLKQAGKDVTILAPLGLPTTDLAKEAYQKALDAEVPPAFLDLDTDPLAQHALNVAEIVVEGIFGIGFHGEIPEMIEGLYEEVNFQHVIRVACDIPGGGNALTGQVGGAFLADLTVTFGAEKIGMSQYPLRDLCGRIRVADIGIPADAFDEVRPAERLHLESVKNYIPGREPDNYKNRFGHALIVAGSFNMRGACILPAMSCMRSGVGLLTCASVEPVLSALMTRLPESMCLSLKADPDGFLQNNKYNQNLLKSAMQDKSAILIGCGMGVTEHTTNLIKFLLRESTCPVILDADGLNAIASCIEYIPGGRTILTPHPGEAGRLLGISTEEVQSDRVGAAKRLAELTDSVVILKGAGTIVTDGEDVSICNAGNPGMAKAGSGDVLAGIVTSFVAQNEAGNSGFDSSEITDMFRRMNLYESACAAVMYHAAAGDRTAEKMPMRYMLPQDIIDSLREVYPTGSAEWYC